MSKVLANIRRDQGNFEALYADWGGATIVGPRAGTLDQRRREVDKDLIPAFRGRTVASINRLEPTPALRAVVARATEVARNLLNHLQGIFERAIDSRQIEDNPLSPVRVPRQHNQQNHPTLEAAQIGAFMRALDATESLGQPTRIAMRLLVLAACRNNEVVCGRWNEIDLDAAEWEIPAERMKAGRAHWVPLSRKAVPWLRELRTFVPDQSDYL